MCHKPVTIVKISKYGKIIYKRESTKRIDTFEDQQSIGRKITWRTLYPKKRWTWIFGSLGKCFTKMEKKPQIHREESFNDPSLEKILKFCELFY
jgi:hypothetical protein